MNIKRIIVLMTISILSGCASPKSDIDYENITTETATTTEKGAIENTEEVTYYNGTTSYEDVLARQPYHVSGYLGVDKDDYTKIKSITYGLDFSQNDIPYEKGIVVFINGIPQKLTDEEGKVEYLPIVSQETEENIEIIYTCLYNNVPKSEKYICNMTNILMPDILITDQRNFGFGHMQTTGISIYEKVQCEPSDSVDIGTIEGTMTSYEEGLFETNILGVGDFNGEYGPTVIERKNCDGNYILEITPEVSGSYVISFWGNLNPIKVGEHLFYQVDVEAGNKYQYSFWLTEEQINSVDNFYAFVCPVEAEVSARKTDTKIFVDEYRK